MKLFELSDYIDVLAVVSEADLDLIMVGGNAVSFYVLVSLEAVTTRWPSGLVRPEIICE